MVTERCLQLCSWLDLRYLTYHYQQKDIKNFHEESLSNIDLIFLRDFSPFACYDP